MKDHSNVTKMHFWMIQRAKKEVFGHFRDFGLLDRLGIAYCDGIKCFSGFGNLTRSWTIIQKSQKCFWMIQGAKKEVFGHFLVFGLFDIAYCDITKCLPTSGNINRSWRIVQRSQKFIFEWSKEPKNTFLAIFWSLDCLIGMILHIVIVLDIFQHLATLPCHEGSFKNH